jgi:hypothetical protein
MAVSKAGHPIRSLDDWKRLAPPKSAHHWVPGRSALELARAWLNGDHLPVEVEALFRAHPDFGPISRWSAEPEAKLRFDEHRGEPRNSDLVVHAEDTHGGFLIAVEGKADEPFGATVANTLAACQKRQLANPRSQGKARVDGLVQWLCPRQLEAEKLAGLRYQLLTATAGTIRAAEQRDYSRAVLLIHEFVTSKTTLRNIAGNALDLNRFVSCLSGGEPVDVKAGQMIGPAMRLSGRVRFYIAKASRAA